MKFGASGTASPPERQWSRREFLAGAAVACAGAVAGCKTDRGASERADEVIDIHQHVGYSGRPDDVLIAHQQEMGISRTILLPSGRPMNTPSTLLGKANGLQAECKGNEECYRLAREHPRKFLFAANEVPDHPEAVKEIERYLKLGAVAIAEQKFSIDCDAPEMQRLYALAAEHRVPILMHWQYGTYNHGFERFHRMLSRFPNTIFIGHAQTWWANIDGAHKDQTVLYPKGKVSPGGLTVRYLADYPNMYGDMSAGSGLNALTRDEEFTREFLRKYQDKLIYGSDCNDRVGSGDECQGAQTIAAIRRLAGSQAVERKIFSANAGRVFRI